MIINEENGVWHSIWLEPNQKRSDPKVFDRSAGLIAIRPAANASKTPPTAEKVWKESERTAIEPV